MAGERQIDRIRAAMDALDEATDALEALDAARRLRAGAEALERDLVKGARKDGRSWSDIGRLYGMTKQGAQQRFRASTSSQGEQVDSAPRPRPRSRKRSASDS